MRWVYYIVSISLLCPVSSAVDTCGRVAVVNHQKILLDTSSTGKGEGVRYLLEKDAKAKSYLDIYQEGNRLRWENALMGTLGSGLLLGGILTSSDVKKKKSLLIGGGVLMLLNFLIAHSLEEANEVHLIRAIEEYNKKNIPKIYLETQTQAYRADGGENLALAVRQVWEF